ncbi:hypothetical protein CEP54_007141 [Fusarium duplospermum]|uniref:Uncharacterized protein n=1 Tax=Fusarium duplospermum TaxID=1325734 RepID=A0A428Q374_9HYPO|nr:hypothetical protein CEP54_007141 [Fusarium duplospermum]
MNNQSERMPLQEHLETAASIPFYSANITKAHGAVYLNQYRLSQWLAASRGLFENTTNKSSCPPRPEEFPHGHLEEDDEMVLARLRKAQASLQTSLSRLDRDLQQLQNALLSTRKNWAARTGLIDQQQLQPLIPLVPSPIAILLIASRERQIWAVAAARSRLEALRDTVESSQPVSPEDTAWLESEEWDGVNWGLVDL